MSDLTILPANATPLEVALDQNTNRLLEIDVDSIRRVKDPYGTPMAFLPFLAWERGVDLWYEDWPEWKKRRITAESYRLKGLKGTLPGINGYLKYVDAKVIDYVVPPQGAVARAQSPERLAQFKARFAQIRVYPFRTRGNRPGVTAKRADAYGATVGRATARANLAPLYYGRQAYLVDGGTETQIRSQDQLRIDTDETSIAATTFAIPGTARVTEAIVGRAAVGSLVMHSTVRARMFVLGADGPNQSGAAIPPGGSSVRVLNIEPEQVYERHSALSYAPVSSARPKMAVGRLVARRARAGRFIYSRWYLFDEDRAGFDPYQALGPVVGRVMAGLTPFRAHLRIDASFAISGRRAVVGKVSVGKAVAGRASDRIMRVGRAVYRAKSLRDTIRFSTRTWRPRGIEDLSFDTAVPFGGMVRIPRRTS